MGAGPSKKGAVESKKKMTNGVVVIEQSNGYDPYKRSRSGQELPRSPMVQAIRIGYVPPPKPKDLPARKNSVARKTMPGKVKSADLSNGTARKAFENSKSEPSSLSVNVKLPRQKSMSRKDSHPISASGREIIQQCLENAHTDLGQRITTRIYEKRPDYQQFLNTCGRDKWCQMAARLKDYIEEVVEKIDDVDAITRLSREYGEEHVQYKAQGFKPDFWVSLVDAITLECIILDLASHPPADTVGAWSQLIGLMFSSVRDGYYSALRNQRRTNRKAQFGRQNTIDIVDHRSNGTALAPPPVTRTQLNRSYAAVYPHQQKQHQLISSNSMPTQLSLIAISAPSLNEEEETVINEMNLTPPRPDSLSITVTVTEQEDQGNESMG